MGFNTIAAPSGTQTGRKDSRSIWGDCPWEDFLDPRSSTDGIAREWNFLDYPLSGTLTTEIGAGAGYKVFGDTGNTITRVVSINSALVPGGALQVTLDTDNDEVTIAQAYPWLTLSGSTSTSGKLWAEFTYAQSSIATNMASVFFGLANVGGITLSTTVPLNDGDPISNTMYGIGFRIAEDGLGVVDTVSTDGATSFTNIGATEGGTLAAYTFTKFGLKYDPTDTTKAVRFYVNGAECATGLPLSAVQAFSNINANGLGWIWSSTADSAGTSFKGLMKRIRIAQQIPG